MEMKKNLFDREHVERRVFVYFLLISGIIILIFERIDIVGILL